MVQLTEVPDEHFESGQAGPIEDEGDYTDTGKSCAPPTSEPNARRHRRRETNPRRSPSRIKMKRVKEHKH